MKFLKIDTGLVVAITMIFAVVYFVGGAFGKANFYLLMGVFNYLTFMRLMK